MWIVVALFGKVRELAQKPVEAGFKSKLGYVVFLPSLERERLALVILRDMKLVIHNKYVKSSLKKQNFGVHLKLLMISSFFFLQLVANGTAKHTGILLTAPHSLREQ